MRRKISTTRPRSRRWLPLLLTSAVVLTLSAIFLVRGIAIGQLKRELAALAQHEQQLIRQQEQLRALLARRDDPEFIEYWARRELGLIKPGEQKYLLREEAR